MFPVLIDRCGGSVLLSTVSDEKKELEIVGVKNARHRYLSDYMSCY